MSMDSKQNLACKYDALAHQFLSLIDSNCLESPEYLEQLQSCRFLDAEKQLEMKRNLPLIRSERVPAKCDVLSLYVELKDQEIASHLQVFADDVLSALPKATDSYKVPLNNYHISVMMFQDFRPADMANTALSHQQPSVQKIGRLADDLERKILALQRPPYSLSLYGIRITCDGAVIAVFTDDGQTLELRRQLEPVAQGFAGTESRKYKKTLIHATLARILDQIDIHTLLTLFEKQRHYYQFRDGAIACGVDELCFGKEIRWMHSRVDILKRVPLKKTF